MKKSCQKQFERLMQGRGLAVLVLSVLAGMFSGCTADPVGDVRIGRPFDVDSFAREHGEENVRVVRFEREKHTYRECTVKCRGARYEIDVSPEGRVIGVTAKVPCSVGAIPQKSTELEARMRACAAKGPTACEIKVKYEPGSRRLVATCCESGHAAAVAAYRKRTKSPER